MAPLLLKLEGNSKSPFSLLDSENELSQTWRVCTKVKDSLENGSRYENLAWRLWFMHNVNAPFKKSKETEKSNSEQPPPPPTTKTKKRRTTRKSTAQQTQQQQQQQQQVPEPVQPMGAAPPSSVPSPLPPAPVQSVQPQHMVPPVAPALTTLPQQQQPLINDPYQAFVLPQFSTDQEINQTVNLQDADMFPGSLDPTAYTNIQLDSWMDLQLDDARSSNHLFMPDILYYLDTPMTMQPQQTMPQPPQHHMQHEQDQQMKNALYVSDECIAPMPHQTLHGKMMSFVPANKLVSSVGRVMDQHPLPQKQKPVVATPSEGKQAICSNCETTTTPLWRRSADDELLCNACGLYAKLHKAPRPRHFENSPQAAGQDEGTRIQCSNCETTTTPLWRRDAEGAPLCNACGLYLKLHHAKRPRSMKTNIIKKRQRTGDAGMPRGIRMINHQFEQPAQQPSPQQQPSHDMNDFHNYVFRDPSP
ncbi:hypothetical protein BJV82DRAFT_714335 [Fennellomyces sp. T-0311]|nr:hypothetical protein BJV82DRAFT_714335 [Fennellomyces sp. T-0311]